MATYIKCTAPYPTVDLTSDSRLLTPDPSPGDIFGDWTVLYSSVINGKRKVFSKCSCGLEKWVDKHSLLRGDSTSCGCKSDEKRSTHGMHTTLVYRTWQSMKRRCQPANGECYADYAGRGIFVCEEWQVFEQFYADMGDPPFKGATLERVDTQKGYSKENCIWASRDTQNNNTRRNVLFEYKGKKHTLKALAELSGLNAKTLSNRLYCYGWTVEVAVETPVLSQADRGQFAA